MKQTGTRSQQIAALATYHAQRGRDESLVAIVCAALIIPVSALALVLFLFSF
jgi:hypothetical protein